MKELVYIGAKLSIHRTDKILVVALNYKLIPVMTILPSSFVGIMNPNPYYSDQCIIQKNMVFFEER